MLEKQIDLEAFGTLLAAINDYRDKLKTNRKILTNAANVCDQAMGSDPISQKKINKLEDALATLDRASLVAKKAAHEVIRKRAEAETIIEEA